MSNQEVLRAYRFALDPSAEQAADLARHAGSARWAFNHGLANIIDAHKAWRARLDTLTEEGHTEAAAKKALKAATVEHRAELKKLDQAQKDLRAAYRAEKDPARRAQLDTRRAQARALMLDKQAQGIREGLVIPSTFDLTAQWNATRDLPKEEGGSPWHESVNTYAFSTGFANAGRAFKNFVDSRSGKRAGRAAGYPRFKKKGRARDSFTLFHDVKKPGIRPESDACNWHVYHGKKSAVTRGRYRGLTLPSIGNVRTHESTKRLARAVRRGTARVQSVTVSRSGDRWYASVLAKVQQDIPDKPTRRQVENGTVGVKWGSESITLACGDRLEEISQPRYMRENARKLAAAQRKASKAERGSGRRQRANARVAVLHHRVAEQRAGWLHQLTARLTQSYEIVALEDLDVQSMIKREQPREKSGRRNAALTDTSPGEFRRQITYKSPWYGATVALTEKALATTRICAECGQQNPRSTPAGQMFRCSHCSHGDTRGRNAARVIARHATVPAEERAAAPDRGEAQNARGVPVRPSPSGETAGDREPGRPAGTSVP